MIGSVERVEHNPFASQAGAGGVGLWSRRLLLAELERPLPQVRGAQHSVRLCHNARHFSCGLVISDCAKFSLV